MTAHNITEMMAPALTQLENFHRNVRLTRLSKGLSAQEAAEACGYTSRQAFERIEKSQHEPMLLTACIVANGLSVDLGALLAPVECPLCRNEPPVGFTCNACRSVGR